MGSQISASTVAPTIPRVIICQFSHQGRELEKMSERQSIYYAAYSSGNDQQCLFFVSLLNSVIALSKPSPIFSLASF
jgi:hypothetical protein